MKNTKILFPIITLIVGFLSVAIIPLILMSGKIFDNKLDNSTINPPITEKPPITDKPEEPNELVKEYIYNLFYLENSKITSSEFKTNYTFEKLIELLNGSNDKFNFGDKEILLSNFLYLKNIENNENFDSKSLLYSFSFQNEIITFREPNKTLEELNKIKNSKKVFHVNENKSIYNSQYIKNDIDAYSTVVDFVYQLVNQREKSFLENIEILKDKTSQEIVDNKLITTKLIFDNIDIFVKGKHNINTIDKIQVDYLTIDFHNYRKTFCFRIWFKPGSLYKNGNLDQESHYIWYAIFWD